MCSYGGRKMNKADLVLLLADKAELQKKEAEVVVDTVLGLIEEAVVKGEEVKLSGFGVIKVKERAAREGTKPGTSEKIVIPASKTVTFKPSKALKEKLN